MAAARAAVALLFAAPAGAVLLRSTGDECACLPWKDVYAKHGVGCGSGHELGNFHVNEVPFAEKFMPAGIFDEFCTRFYMQVSSSSCFNKKFGPASQQWCYVSAGCESAKRVAGKDVAIQNCSAAAGDDLMMGKAPEELNRQAEVDGLEVGLFGKLSYPMDAAKWSDVELASGLPTTKLSMGHVMESYYGIQFKGAKPESGGEEAQKKVAAIVASGMTTIFDSDNGHGGGNLLAGHKIYGFLPVEGKHGLFYTCIHGCDA